MWCWGKNENLSLSTTYFAYCIHNDNYSKCICCTIPVQSGTLCEQRMGLTKSKQVHLFRQMCEHICFVTMSATEIGCLCEHDSLSFLSQRLIVFVRVCWCMSSAPCLIKPASHRHSILEVSYSLTPLDAARVTNSILYLFCLPPSLVSLSHSAFV